MQVSQLVRLRRITAEWQLFNELGLIVQIAAARGVRT